MYPVNKDIVKEILMQMPAPKKEVLSRALTRNFILTSSLVLNCCVLTVYKEGWLISLTGTRCSFSIFAKDNDGEYEFIRKPAESKLHKLYTDYDSLSESYFDDLKKEG